ncbi:HYR-like domain-containing protein, partial [Maribellus maritimus]|uniref:HYR-like domain-containing protein n=1 Tax=Maribellus maritimus TaxID=2870838 RepID=UPI00374DE0A8|nr:hypothetical protein [Maribellus maritimus]
ISEFNTQVTFPYSETASSITVAEFEALGGTATDNCNVFTITYQDISDGLDCPETITRTYTVTDNCGNSETCAQTITLNDNTPPSIACPNNLTIIGCDLSGLLDSTGLNFSSTPTTLNLADTTILGISVSDNCGIYEITYQDDSTGICPIVVTRTFTVTDSCRNTASCPQIINIYFSPPTITCPTDTITDTCLTQAQVDQIYADWIAAVS